MADIAGASKALDQFKKLINSGNHQKASDALTDVKLRVVQFQGLPPMLQDTPTRDKELMLARDMLEHSVFLSVSLQARFMGHTSWSMLSQSPLRTLLHATLCIRLCHCHIGHACQAH